MDYEEGTCVMNLLIFSRKNLDLEFKELNTERHKIRKNGIVKLKYKLLKKDEELLVN